MGGHGGAKGNSNNIQETDADMQDKIQLIETVKHSPNHFHLDFFEAGNWFNILGGANTMAFGGTGAGVSYLYWAGKASTNHYVWNINVFQRLGLGLVLGLGIGYMRFGDRQKLHNAYTAERLRRRYPESMSLAHPADSLWKFKNVHAPQEFYKWH